MSVESTTTARGRVPVAAAVEPSSSLYVLLGQAFVFLFMVFGFGMIPLTRLVVMLAVSALGILALLVGPPGALRRVVVSTTLMLYLGWYLISYTWANDPASWMLVARQDIPPVIAMVCVASVLTTRQILQAIVAFTYVAVAVTITLLIVTPSTAAIHEAIEPGGSRLPGWHGSFDHKTGMATTLLVGALAMLLYQRPSRVRTVTLVVIAVLVVGSQSSTGLLVLLVIGGLYLWLDRFLLRPPKRVGSYVVLWGIGGLFIAVALWLVLPELLDLRGKDLTLSGRTKIWDQAVGAISERPWAGYGIGGVWRDGTLQPTIDMNRQLGFVVYHSHSGVLEMMLQLGAIGLGLWCAFFVATFAGGLRLLRIDRRLGMWVTLLCSLVALTAISEATVFGGFLVLLAAARVLSIRAAEADRLGLAWEAVR